MRIALFLLCLVLIDTASYAARFRFRQRFFGRRQRVQQTFQNQNDPNENISPLTESEHADGDAVPLSEGGQAKERYEAPLDDITENPGPSEVPEANTTNVKGYVKSARWVGDRLEYFGTNGKWVRPMTWYKAKKDGEFLNAYGERVPYVEGDIIFKRGKNDWYVAKKDSPQSLNYAETVPNPYNVEISETEKMVIHLTNVERMRSGLKPLYVNPSMMPNARKKSHSMSHGWGMTHGAPPTTGFRGENIAAGQGSPTEVMRDWMNSSGHRANILGSGYKSIGVAVENAGNGPYWTQQFD